MSSELFVVELAGTPGVGKTTVAGALVDTLRDAGRDAATIIDAARRHARRTAAGHVVARIPHRRVRHLALWYVFYVGSAVHGLGFAARHPGLVQHVLRARRARRRAGDDVGRTHATFWFFQLCGRLAFLRATARPGEILVVDDGFLHRTVHLHATTRGFVDADAVEEYAQFLPGSDLLVRLTAPDELCCARVQDRGIWAHARHLEPAALESYLAAARQAVDIAGTRAGDRGLHTITVENHERALDDVVREITVALDKAATAPASRSGARTRMVRVPRPSRVRAIAAGRFGTPALSADRVREVLDRYGLETGAAAPSDLRVGRRSLNAAIATTGGPKVVKQYRPLWNEELVGYGHAVIDRLEQRAFPAVRLTRTHDGRTHVVVDGAIYAVFDFVDGTCYSLQFLRRADRLALAATAGNALAGMHRELDGFVPPGAHHLGFTSASGPRVRDLAWHASTLDDLVTRTGADLPRDATGPARVLVARVDRTLADIEALEAKLAPYDLPRLVVHGDFGLHNLLFPEPQRAVVVDFESARLDWRVNDLVSALGKYRRRDRRFDVEAMETFARAYARRFPLSDDERACFAKAWELYRLRASVQYWRSYFETAGPARKLESAVDALEQADWASRRPELVEHLARLAAASATWERAS